MSNAIWYPHNLDRYSALPCGLLPVASSASLPRLQPSELGECRAQSSTFARTRQQFVRAICRNTPRKALQMLHVCHDLKRANNGIPGESALYATSRRAWPSSEVVSNERSSRAVGFVAPRCRRSMRQLPHAVSHS
ncbi:hypothetical protein KC332_g67 [Hortaea werneckii]|nr:hypothetical protein KC348_g73 [Hortaea werneckii]KAI7421918.1 hypothetical protein KC332_g67 [Hortaea werneckii]